MRFRGGAGGRHSARPRRPSESWEKKMRRDKVWGVRSGGQGTARILPGLKMGAKNSLKECRRLLPPPACI